MKNFAVYIFWVLVPAGVLFFCVGRWARKKMNAIFKALPFFLLVIILSAPAAVWAEDAPRMFGPDEEAAISDFLTRMHKGDAPVVEINHVKEGMIVVYRSLNSNNSFVFLVSDDFIIFKNTGKLSEAKRRIIIQAVESIINRPGYEALGKK